MPETRYCMVDLVQVGDRLRSLDPDKVAALAESMNAIGLQQPISVWSDSIDTLELVAGLHRLEAARKLGWEDIDCIYVYLDDLDRQLWEIDENLCRTDLTDAERASHVVKRAEVVKQRAEIKQKAAELTPESGVNPKRGPKSKGLVEFIADTAKKTGRSEASVYKDLARGKNIAKDVQKEIAGTKIADSGVQLDALAKVTHEEQREAVKAVNLGQAKDVREVLPGAGGQKRKKRRTSAEIHLDNFAHAIRFITGICDLARKIDVPNLDSKRRSSAVAALRNAGKHIQESIEIIQHSHEENEPARRMTEVVP